jgi:hypothetical protein
MQFSRIRHLRALISFVVLVACNGPETTVPTSPSYSQPQAVRHADSGTSWMLPEAKHDSLLYVSNLGLGSFEGYLKVYSYPAGRFVGKVRGVGDPAGLCIDKAQDIYVAVTGPPGQGFRVLEYRHGGTDPIKMIKDYDGQAVSCAVDRVTGDLAVVSGYGTGRSYVLIYKHASGAPKEYSDSGMRMSYCGYDDAGNLYVDGVVSSHLIELATLPKGGKALTNVTLNEDIGAWIAGAVQWDGQHLAVGGSALDSREEVIYQVDITGSVGTVVGTTPLTETHQWGGEFWIDGATVVAPTFRQARPRVASVRFYAYPAGDSPTKSLTHGLYGPGAVAISASN